MYIILNIYSIISLVIKVKIVGIIVEYNPLHNGHMLHINKIKELAKPDVIVACMSSSLTMRGDLSLFDKFTKTKQALEANVDIVVELPVIYAMQRADIFAKNAVSLLNQFKVSEIWIGSEENNPKLFEECYNAFKNKEEYIKEELKKGFSYKEVTDNIYPLNSNDLLGYSYYKAVKDNNFSIEIKTIKRESSNYLDNRPTNSFIASALAIRNNIDLLSKYTPSFISNDKDKILDENKLFSFLKYKILSSSTKELKELFFVDEGIENKLIDIYKYNSFDDFIKYLTSKRYTASRIKRMSMFILLNIKKTDINIINTSNLNYSRLLGYNDIGKKYIKIIKKDITLYTNIKEGINLVLDFEFRLSKLLDNIYDLNLIKQEQSAPIYKKNSN